MRKKLEDGKNCFPAEVLLLLYNIDKFVNGTLTAWLSCLNREPVHN